MLIFYFYFALQRKQKDVARENEFYLGILQQALPAELQTVNNLQQQVQPQVQLQAQISTMTVEQNSKSQPLRPNSHYSSSPEKSRSSLQSLTVLFQSLFPQSMFHFCVNYLFLKIIN